MPRPLFLEHLDRLSVRLSLVLRVDSRSMFHERCDHAYTIPMHVRSDTHGLSHTLTHGYATRLAEDKSVLSACLKVEWTMRHWH
jgi:hypothetical protein